MGTHGMGVYGINSKFASGNLVFYEKAVGRTATGDVLTIGTTAVTVGNTSNAVDFTVKGTGASDLGVSCEANAYTVGGVAGEDESGSGTITTFTITIVKGIVTAFAKVS